MSAHLSLLSQMKTVSYSIYDVQGLVLLLLSCLREAKNRLLLGYRICKCKQIGMPTGFRARSVPAKHHGKEKLIIHQAEKTL